MDLDYQKIHHNFITRIVIFSVFLYKNLRRQENVYENSIRSFLRKRISQDIEFSLEVGPKMPKDEMRNSLIDSIFDPDSEGETLFYLVQVRFKTSLMDVNMQIDLNSEDKYEDYLYS